METFSRSTAVSGNQFSAGNDMNSLVTGAIIFIGGLIVGVALALLLRK